MKRWHPFALAGLILVTLVAVRITSSRESDARAVHARLPLTFEPNAGQWDTAVAFSARTSGYRLGLARNGATFAFPGETVHLGLVGATPGAPPVGAQRAPGTVNYLIGDDPAGWRTGLPTFGRVEVPAVWPGVDLAYHGAAAGDLEYDFIVAPGADTGAIRLAVSGARRLKVADGDLVIETSGGRLVQHRPVAYQERLGGRDPVAADWVVAGDEARFRLGRYDTGRRLVIDPVVDYSTYLGGAGGDAGGAVTVDAAGAAYVAGATTSTDFPVTAGTIQSTNRGGATDAFVTKLNPGGVLAWSTYLGGALQDVAKGVALDGTGAVYVAGGTVSADFPVNNAAQPAKAATDQSFGPNHEEAFLTKLTPDGTAIVYSTFLGGPSNDTGAAVAVDGTGAASLVGQAGYYFFPTKPAAPSSSGSGPPFDAFLARFAPDGSLSSSVLLGGNGKEDAMGVAVDGTGASYVAGSTESTSFPTANAFQASMAGGGIDAFLTKMASDGTTIVYSTYLGGSGGDVARAVAVDGAGAAYVTGPTNSANFPTAAAAQSAIAGANDAFLTKVAPNGTALEYSTYLGGTGGDDARAVAVDAAGAAHVAGEAGAGDFPVRGLAVTGFGGGGTDAFLARMTPGGALDYSTFLGGTAADLSGGVALDGAGGAYVVGTTASADFPVTGGAVSPARAGTYDAFVTRVVKGVVTRPDAYDVGRAPLATGAPGVLANDAGDDPPLTALLGTAPAHGTLDLHPDGSFTYTPAARYQGADSFTYKARNSAGLESAATAVALTIASNRLPVAVDDEAATTAGTPVTIAVTANDTDADGDPLNAALAAAPQHGTATCARPAAQQAAGRRNPGGGRQQLATLTGICTYTPAAGYTGPDSFTYTVFDDRDAGSTARVTITVVPAGTLAVADDGRTTTQDTTVSIPVTANDVLGRLPTVLSLAEPPAHGTATCDGEACVYTPALGYTGADAFTYRLRDASGQTATGRVALTVTPAPAPSPAPTEPPRPADTLPRTGTDPLPAFLTGLALIVFGMITRGATRRDENQKGARRG